VKAWRAQYRVDSTSPCSSFHTNVSCSQVSGSGSGSDFLERAKAAAPAKATIAKNYRRNQNAFSDQLPSTFSRSWENYQTPEMATQTTTASTFNLPLPYRLFFLLIEPISTLLGAYYAYFKPSTYLSETAFPAANFLPSNPSTSNIIPLPTSSLVTLQQLANLYVAFAINEALVLRSTSDLKVWRALLLGLLIADFGHLWSVRHLGLGYYWRVWEWNAMAWGNVGFVYVGATMRMCFLVGVGLDDGKGTATGKGRKKDL